MVLDATSVAFPRPTSSGHRSTLNLPLASTAPSAPSVLGRPTKRRRTMQHPLNSPLTSPSPGPSSVRSMDLDALDAARRRSSARVMSLWESLAARYARSLDEDDEIDILTGKIYKDRGVLRAASGEGWAIGSFGGTLEVEPVTGANETETDTGTSECDDEGIGESTIADLEDTDEEEDPFETWSYDWQYRELPPPRPELSPQDAEDLEEFLAAERAIQEASVQEGKCKPDPDEGVEDEIVYLGDSLHQQDGALRDDDSDDEEFSSFAVDDLTVHFTKREEDEEDGIEPMSSILGALALNKTPRKPSPEGTGNTDDKTSSKPGGSRDQNSRLHRPVTPLTQNLLRYSPSTSGGPASEAGVEDELIVISDTDEEASIASDSQERIPSSQVHERLMEERVRKGKGKPRPTKVKDPPLATLKSRQPQSNLKLQHGAPPGSSTNTVAPVARRNLPSPRISTPKRESSVINIESDSDDELADFNAGEGSMRWEPLAKGEEDSNSDPLDLNYSGDDILLLGSLPEGRAKRQSRPRRGRVRRQSSPLKPRI